MKIKGLHQLLVTQELFDTVQDALAGKTATGVPAPPIVHKKVNDDFPLKGFLKCAGYEKKLTAGWTKGRKESYARYWCWYPKCPAKVGASRDEIEMSFVRILAMLRPTQELLNRLPEIAKTYWAHRLERITAERKAISNRLSDTRTLNQKILLQKVNGELSPEDFTMLKETVTQQKADAETQLAALDAEIATMQGLLEETQNNIVDLVKAWRTGNVQQPQELAFTVYPGGLVYSRELRYFEPRNVLLMQAMREMIDGVLAEENIGAGDGI